jgi:hypothetical protein
MKVGFYHVDLKPGGRRYTQRMVDSVRQAMPGIPIMQFGRVPSDRIEGVTEFRQAAEGPLVLSSLRSYASLPDEQWLFFDTDVIVQQDLAHIFRHQFHIAVVSREGTLTDQETRTKYMTRMPYNKAVVFSRKQTFWQAALAWLEARPKLWTGFYGDQWAMCEAIKSAKFQVMVLPSEYNYPLKRKDEDVRDKVVIHFKGSRKRWMPC